MSFFPGNDPVPGDAFACDAIEHLIIPRSSDIGGFAVFALPAQFHDQARELGQAGRRAGADLPTQKACCTPLWERVYPRPQGMCVCLTPRFCVILGRPIARSPPCVHCSLSP